jgi:hypothetical protein
VAPFLQTTGHPDGLRGARVTSFERGNVREDSICPRIRREHVSTPEAAAREANSIVGPPDPETLLPLGGNSQSVERAETLGASRA